MNTPQKLSLLVIVTIITVSFSSCFVRHSEHRKWHKRYNRAYRMGGHHGQSGRKLWVRDRFKNTH